MTCSDTEFQDEFLNKFRLIEQKLAQQKGAFVLFALIMREDSGGKWDVVVSAPWIKDTREGLQTIIDEMSSQLTPEELVEEISRIATVELTHPLVETLTQRITIEHGMFNAGNLIVGGHEFGRACIITSKKPGAAFPQAGENKPSVSKSS